MVHAPPRTAVCSQSHKSLINSHLLSSQARPRAGHMWALLWFKGTFVSDGPGFLHIARKAHAGRGSLPPAALRSLVVVIGRVA